MNRLHLQAEREGERWRLLAPDAGVFTAALEPGAALAPGQSAGILLRLGRAATLVVPEGVRGIVTSTRPERVHAPVGAGDVLYELTSIDAIEATSLAPAPRGAASPGGHPVVRSPQTGRFYASPSPTTPPFVAEGTELRDGAAIGLIEVMKTFTQIAYRTADGLPARARVLRVLVADGADVDAGDPLVEVAADPASASELE